jgi:ribonuclease VapC
MISEAHQFVFDSFAILSFLQDEPGAEQVERILKRADSGTARVWMNEINLGEVFYTLLRRRGETIAEEKVLQIQSTSIILVSNDWNMVKAAARLKAKFRASYADCFAAVTAMIHDAQVVTGDPEFEALEKHVSVKWLPRK